jgi:hypothetical protein
MVRVVTHGRYRVYVYAEKGGQHNAPHCHVEWADGSCVVDIETLMILRGPVDRRALDLVRDHQAQIRTVWDLLNGQET